MRYPRPAIAGLLGVLVLSGCGGTAAGPAPAPASVQHNAEAAATFGTTDDGALTYNPGLVPAGSHGAVSSSSGAGKTTVKLAVRGLASNRAYGAHAHTQACGKDPKAAGPHFQNVVDPVQPSVDPKFANPENEIWLDFTTDATGAATVDSASTWAFPADRRAHSIVIHETATAKDPGHAGTAGNRLACVTVDF